MSDRRTHHRLSWSRSAVIYTCTDMFSGFGGLTRALIEFGPNCLPFDAFRNNVYGKHEDQLVDSVFHKVLKGIRAGVYAYVNVWGTLFNLERNDDNE